MLTTIRTSMTRLITPEARRQAPAIFTPRKPVNVGMKADPSAPPATRLNRTSTIRLAALNESNSADVPNARVITIPRKPHQVVDDEQTSPFRRHVRSVGWQLKAQFQSLYFHLLVILSICSVPQCLFSATLRSASARPALNACASICENRDRKRLCFPAAHFQRQFHCDRSATRSIKVHPTKRFYHALHPKLAMIWQLSPGLCLQTADRAPSFPPVR